MVDEIGRKSVQGHAMSGSRKSSDPSNNPLGPKAPKGPRVALDALLTGSAADPIRRALWLDALDQRLRPYLPPSLAAHARLANVNGEQLVFLVDSPVWRARLRLATPELLVAARSVGLDATEVVIRTSTPLPEADRPARPPRLMSASTREALQAALGLRSDTLPDGPETPIHPPERADRGGRGQAS